MKISFFEEFPTKNNLNKLNLVTWPTTVYVATKSIKELNKIKLGMTNKKNITIGYWPILKQEEGYWLSPFSSRKAVKRIIHEINNYKKPLKVMWDAELPFRYPKLFFKINNFLINKPRIKKFFRQHGKNIYTSEYAVKNSFFESLLTWLGVSFSPKNYKNKKIVMYYTSMHKMVSHLFLKNIERLQRKYKNNLQVALGTIAVGIHGNEPILSPKKLERDLKDMKRIGIKEVVIFRVGGLNKEYTKVLKKFI